MVLLQYFTPKIAHSSYILAGSRTCAIVDPRRDVQVYIDAAKSLGTRITHILETHLHADFVSGHLDLAQKTGATIYAPSMGKCSFDHVPVSEGDEIVLEDMVLQVHETPGHTPEHVSYAVVDTSRGARPVAVFCGDTLFVGDVGRPDLFPGRARELAEALYASLHDKLLKLPEFCEVYPAHAAGSLCGRAIAAKRQSTVGYERLYNIALAIDDLETFVASLTSDMPAAPDHFGRCSAINGRGPALVSSLPTPRALPPREFARLAANADTVVIDARPYPAFGGQHVAGSFSLDLAGNFPTFAGWVVPPDKDILLVTSDAAQVSEAVDWLRRVGMDRTMAYLEGGMAAWAVAGLPMSHVPQLSAQELQEVVLSSPGAVIVDTRAPAEYRSGHIPRSISIQVADLRTRYTELDRSAETVVVCSTGNRSSLGTSLLMQKGFADVKNAAGGVGGFATAGYSLVES
ncbi:MAG: rhodanese-like domain-containing protein [Dehalococcoidia bacterium]|jgi:glyoxylase-like metal-dependent hydrolase (beta-lactamase superfamily II)|nr:rhodanese-like domain-containing protein [Dehalococcoidia bacterium]